MQLCAETDGSERSGAAERRRRGMSGKEERGVDCHLPSECENMHGGGRKQTILPHDVTL